MSNDKLQLKALGVHLSRPKSIRIDDSIKKLEQLMQAKLKREQRRDKVMAVYRRNGKLG